MSASVSLELYYTWWINETLDVLINVLNCKYRTAAGRAEHHRANSFSSADRAGSLGPYTRILQVCGIDRTKKKE